MTHGPWKGPSTIPNTGISTVTTEGRSQALDKSVDKLPPVLAGMDRAEALAFVSRLYDSAQAGAHIWGDALLVKRFLTQCSRTGSQETRDGYRRLYAELCANLTLRHNRKSQAIQHLAFWSLSKRNSHRATTGHYVVSILRKSKSLRNT